MCKCDTIQIVSPPPPPFARKEEWHSDAFKDFVQELVKTDPRWSSGLDEKQCYQWILLAPDTPEHYRQ